MQYGLYSRRKFCLQSKAPGIKASLTHATPQYLSGSARRGPAPATPTRAPTTVVTSTVQLDAADSSDRIERSNSGATNQPANTSASAPSSESANTVANLLANTAISTPLSPSRRAPPPPSRESSQQLVEVESRPAEQPKERVVEQIKEIGELAGVDLNQPSAEKLTLQQLLKLPPVWQPNPDGTGKTTTDQSEKSGVIPIVSATEQPILEQSSTEKPILEQSVPEEPIIQQSATEEPVFEQPSAKEADSSVEQSSFEQSSADQPALEQPSAEQLALERLLKQPPVWQPKEQMESSDHFLSNTLSSELIPSLHHAESASVRAEETTDSSSEEEVDTSSGSRRISVTINPMSEPGPPLSVMSNTPRLEAPPSHPHPWGPSPRLRQETSIPLPSNSQLSSHEAFSHSASSFIQPSPVQRQTPERESEMKMVPERSFQDPAFTTFHEEKDIERQKQKKKGFFSFFKKINKKKQPYGDDFIHIERRLDVDDEMGESEEGATDLEGDQSPRFHILQPDQPTVPMPGSSAASRRLFAMEQQHNEHLFQQQQAEQRLQQEEAEQYLQQQEAELLSQQQQAHFSLQQEHDNQWSQQQNLQGEGHLQYDHYETEQTSSQHFVQHQTELPVQQQHVDQEQQPAVQESSDLQQFSEAKGEKQEDSVELFTEEDEVAPLPANLQRRPSASRPTDIDDLILKHNTKMNSYSGEKISEYISIVSVVQNS